MNPLLRAIAEDPADDSLRLIYADYIEEQGDAARAEFVRLQIDLANLSPLPRKNPSIFDLLTGKDYKSRKGLEFKLYEDSAMAHQDLQVL